MQDQETFRQIYQNKFDKYSKTIQPEPCSCPESSSQDDSILKYLLCFCYTELVIMRILTMMIMVKMANLEKEEWVWFKIYSGMLFIFSIPSLLVSTSMLILPLTNVIHIQPGAITRKTLKMMIKIPRIETTRTSTNVCRMLRRRKSQGIFCYCC